MSLSLMLVMVIETELFSADSSQTLLELSHSHMDSFLISASQQGTMAPRWVQ